MRLKVQLFSLISFFILVITLYVAFSSYYFKQQDNTAFVIIESLQHDISELSYSVSKNIKDKKEIKAYRAFFDRAISSNSYVANVMVFDEEDKLLFTSDTKLKDTIADEMIYHPGQSVTLKQLAIKNAMEGTIRFYHGAKRHELRLLFILDTQEISALIQQNRGQFLFTFALVPIIVFIVLSAFIQLIIIRPLTQLREFATDQSTSSKPFMVQELEDIRLSLSDTFSQLVSEQQKLKKFQTVIEQSPVSVIITDLLGNIEYVNPQFMNVTGYSYDEVLGKNPSMLSSKEISKDEYKAMWDKVTKGQVWKGAFKNLKKSGEAYWESAIIAPLKNNDNKIVNYIGIKQDISEKIAMEGLLKDQEELMIAQSRHAAMGEMISMIAHQWRQPITVITMGANNILVDVELGTISEETLRLEANSIIEQAQHLSKTIDDFRDFFRPNKGKEETRVQDVFAEAVKIVGKSLENDSIALSIKENETGGITTYSRELLQVFLNLLKNSKEALVEHTQEDRHIDVVIDSDEDKITTTICDNGGGIADKTIEKIFEPYFSTKNEKTGTGLGLYMSKTIVEKHLHGSISVTSKDGTTCFTVVVPKISYEESPHE